MRYADNPVSGRTLKSLAGYVIWYSFQVSDGPRRCLYMDVAASQCTSVLVSGNALWSPSQSNYRMPMMRIFPDILMQYNRKVPTPFSRLCSIQSGMALMLFPSGRKRFSRAPQSSIIFLTFQTKLNFFVKLSFGGLHEIALSR